MSWGERSCVFAHLKDRPCKPTSEICNTDCPHYTYDGFSKKDTEPPNIYEAMMTDMRQSNKGMR